MKHLLKIHYKKNAGKFSLKYIAFLTALFLVSCTSDFNSIEQAKNEFNKQGFRDGRWVQFLNEQWEHVENKSEGYKFYVLSEFKDGKLKGSSRAFNADGKLLQVRYPFKDDKTRCEKKCELRFETIEVYDSLENKETAIINNNEGFKIEEIRYYTSGPNKGKLKSKTKIQYNIASGKKEKIDGVLYIYAQELKEHKFHFVFGDNSIYKLALEHPVFKEKFENALNADLEGNKMLKSLVFDENNLEEFPYMLKIAVLDGDTANVDAIFMHQAQKYDEEQERRNKNNVACSYCGRRFDKNAGFVKGLGISYATPYSNALAGIQVAKSVGYPKENLRLLKESYDRGTWFCSRRCVDFSGNIIGGY